MRDHSSWQGRAEIPILRITTDADSRAGDGKISFAQQVPSFTLHQRGCHQPKHMQGFPGTNQAPIIPQHGGCLRASPSCARSRLQRAHEAAAGQRGASMLLSQHALIRGTHSQLMISWPCQPVPAPASFLCCLPGVSEQRGALCALLVTSAPPCEEPDSLSLCSAAPCPFPVCLSVAGGLSSPVWQTPRGVRALLPPEPTAHHPQGSIWPLSPASSHLAPIPGASDRRKVCQRSILLLLR